MNAPALLRVNDTSRLFAVVLSPIIIIAALSGGCGRHDATSDVLPDPAVPADPPGERPITPPNFVVIITDDQPLGYMDALPFVNKYVFGRGVSFTNAFVTTSLCCPSRVSMLTGKYAHNHGVLSNAGRGGADAFRNTGADASTLATWLASSGYRTAYVGKFLNQYPSELPGTSFYIPPGWNDWHAAIDVFPSDTPYAQVNYGMIENGVVTRYGSRDYDYFSDVVKRKSLDFVSRVLSTGEPFFLVMGFVSPHASAEYPRRHERYFRHERAPRTAAFNELDISDKPIWLSGVQPMDSDAIANLDNLHRKMLRSLISVDEAVQAVVQLVADRDALKSTYFVFISDNGLHLGEHRIAHDKNTPYEEAIRVPMAILGPGLSNGVTRTEIVLNLDLAPTILDLAGLQSADTVDGRSLVPLAIRNASNGIPWRRRFLIEHFTPHLGEGDRPDARPNRLEYYAIRTDEHLYVEYAYGDFELYDLYRDRNQLENAFSNAPPELLGELRQQLIALRACVGFQCRLAEE